MWHGEVLKAIAFPVTVANDAPTLWHLLTGAMPDNSQKRGLPPPILSTASGLWRNLQLTIVVQPNRIEANVTAIDPNPSRPVPVPPIPTEDLEAAFAVIRDVAAHIVKGSAVRRIGAATQLVRKVDTLVDGVALLNDQLGGRFPPNATDTLYQINIRGPLGSCPGEMNRLCKWGVAKVGSLGVSVDQSGNVSQIPMNEEAVNYAYLHLDINNVAFVEPISGEIAQSLIEELWGEEARVRSGGIDVLA